MFKKCFLALFAAFSIFTPNIFGQVTTGSIQGVVTDPNGAVVPGAVVRVTNVPTGVVRETTTNDDGFYRVTNLIPGDSYRVEVSAPNFQTTTAQPVAVRLAAENVAHIRLNVTGASATVDLGFLKTTKIYEDLRVEFRAEASNLFNRRNFGVPDPITEDAFILLTSTSGFVGTFQNPGFNNGGSRTLRFGIRVLF